MRAASNDESRSRRILLGFGSVDDDRFVIVFMRGFLGADCDRGVVNDLGLTLTDAPFLMAFRVFACCSAVLTSLKTNSQLTVSGELIEVQRGGCEKFAPTYNYNFLPFCYPCFHHFLQVLSFFLFFLKFPYSHLQQFFTCFCRVFRNF